MNQIRQESSILECLPASRYCCCQRPSGEVAIFFASFFLSVFDFLPSGMCGMQIRKPFPCRYLLWTPSFDLIYIVFAHVVVFHLHLIFASRTFRTRVCRYLRKLLNRTMVSWFVGSAAVVFASSEFLRWTHCVLGRQQFSRTLGNALSDLMLNGEI